MRVLLVLLCACGSASSAGALPDASVGDTDVPGDAASPGTDAGDAALTDGSGTTCVQALAGTHTFTCSGIVFTVSAPASCASQACGLILDVHGLGMSADTEDANTDMRAIGNAAGYVVVQPTAPTTTAYGPAWYDTDDDHVWAGFMSAATAWNVDKKRIHVTGFSQGGYMTWRLICAHSDVLASAAPGAAGTTDCPSYNLNTSCSFSGSQVPAMPIDVLFVAGTKDAIVLSACSTAQVDAVVAAWGGSKQNIAGDLTYTRDRYTGTAGKDFEVLTHLYTTDPLGSLAANAGHCMPGATPHSGTIWDQLPCKPPNSFVWGAEALSFFKAHPKK